MKFPLLFSLLVFSAFSFAEQSHEVLPAGKISTRESKEYEGIPGAGPRVLKGYDVFLTADFLLWQANQGSLQYASTGYSLDGTTSPAKGNVYYPELHYRMGFSIGLGVNLDYDMWDTYAKYTWFGSFDNKDSITASQTDGLRPSFTAPISLGSGDYYNSASGLWSMRLNVFDLELGRNCQVTQYLTMRPFFGMKGALKSQNVENHYAGISSSEAFAYDVSSDSSFYGVGARGGLETTWHVSSMWSFFANGALSTLWGRFQTSRQDDYQVGADPAVTPILVENNEYTTIPVLELNVGIRKETWLCENRYHLSVEAGWEEQIWWTQNRFSPSDTQVLGSSLTLQGLTARVRLDF